MVSAAPGTYPSGGGGSGGGGAGPGSGVGGPSGGAGTHGPSPSTRNWFCWWFWSKLMVGAMVVAVVPGVGGMVEQLVLVVMVVLELQVLPVAGPPASDQAIGP